METLWQLGISFEDAYKRGIQSFTWFLGARLSSYAETSACVRAEKCANLKLGLQLNLIEIFKRVLLYVDAFVILI